MHRLHIWYFKPVYVCHWVFILQIYNTKYIVLDFSFHVCFNVYIMLSLVSEPWWLFKFCCLEPFPAPLPFPFLIFSLPLTKDTLLLSRFHPLSWLILCLVDINKSHLGRETLSWESTSIRLTCRVLSIFDWLTDVRKPHPLWLVLTLDKSSWVVWRSRLKAGHHGTHL